MNDFNISDVPISASDIPNIPISAIDTFSGIGGMHLGLSLISDLFPRLKLNTKLFIEIDTSAQKVLRSHFPEIPIYPDIRTYHPNEKYQLLIGTPPCTGTSLAGKKNGLNHPESALFWELLRIADECRPDFILIEQPEGAIHTALRTMLGGFRVAGYKSQATLISASELGAPHRRLRLFIIAYSHEVAKIIGQRGESWPKQVRDDVQAVKSLAEDAKNESSSLPMDDVVPSWLGGVGFARRVWGFPPLESGVPKNSPRRVDCINLYGQSVCPLQAAVAGMEMLRLMEMYYLQEKQ